jgi:hypothetical protein
MRPLDARKDSKPVDHHWAEVREGHAHAHGRHSGHQIYHAVRVSNSPSINSELLPWFLSFSMSKLSPAVP